MSRLVGGGTQAVSAAPVMIPRRSALVLPIRIVIEGPPRTKKTHNQIGFIGKPCPSCGRGEYTKVFPSKEWRHWVRDAAITGYLVGREPSGFPWPRYGLVLPARRYNAAALFYREKAIGDAMGFYQGLSDLLTERGIIPDDKWLVQWDGSRLLKDAEHPRVELVLTSAEAALDPV